MVGPTKTNPRRLSSLAIAVDSGVVAGTSPGPAGAGRARSGAKDQSRSLSDSPSARVARALATVASAQVPARYLFQHLGFHIEALLAECVIDEQGHTQDLIFMSYDVAGFHA